MNMNHKNDSISTLKWEDDQYFAGFGQAGLWIADLGIFQLERSRNAEGKVTTVIYARAAMSRAAERSRKAGGGVMGLCSSHLRDGEYREVPDDALIGDALSIAKGLR